MNADNTNLKDASALPVLFSLNCFSILILRYPRESAANYYEKNHDRETQLCQR